MRFLHEEDEKRELTYEDAFLLPQYSDIASRMDVDITPPDKTGATIPIAVANMTSAAGKRMAETVTRRGGLVFLTQDMPLGKVREIVEYVKSRHSVFETPVILNESETIQTGLNLIHKRAHGAVVVVNKDNRPIGIFEESDAEGHDKFSPVREAMSEDIISADESISPEEAFNKMHRDHVSILPILSGSGEMLGILTKNGAVRSTIYKPALNAKGQLLTAVAMGTSKDTADRAKALLEMGVDIFMIDTAHGHSKKMLEAIRVVREIIGKDKIIYAGTVVTAKATADLIEAGANIVKVGIGAGGSCTTRVMTANGRPQFSAVIECAKQAKEMGAYIWADSRIREPRDLALAIAGGASSTMFGTIMAGTYESPGDIHTDETGRMYKVSIGMASSHAVKNRFGHLEPFDLARRQYFKEGTHDGRIYIKEELSGAEDIIDRLTAGLRSAMSYAGAKSIEEFQEKAVIGVQTPAGYAESNPLQEH